MRIPLALALLLGLTSRGALAEERRAITVAVGQTVEVEVGFAMGHLCDDPEVVRARMRDKTRETNAFVVTGLRPGTTLCRVGTVAVEDRPTFLYEITVVPARPAPPPR